MKALVVYESLWGNTAAVARAVAEGIGPEAACLSTAKATVAELEGAELIVAGAPVLGFKLPTDQMRDGIRKRPGKAPAPPDLSHPSLRSWLAELPAGHGRGAAFDTQVKGPFGKAAPEILDLLEKAGYAPATGPIGFIVTGRYGPLKDGELERARAWGVDLARAGR